MDLVSIATQFINYVGSAMPLAILCFMIVFLLFGRKVKAQSLISYLIIAVLMFIILLRT